MLNVKKSNLLSIVFILLLSSYFSCETTQKESLQNNNLKIDYYLRYLQSDKLVKAEISFSEVIDSTKKNTPVRMSEVLFQNNALDEKKIKHQYKYHLLKKMPFADTYTFSYRKNAQQVATQSVFINAISDFSIKKNEVSKLNGTTLTLTGSPLQDDESIIVLLSDANNKTVTFQAKEMAINILPEKVSDLAIGQGSIYVVRKKLSIEDADIHQIISHTEYYSEIKNIKILQ